MSKRRKPEPKPELEPGTIVLSPAPMDTGRMHIPAESYRVNFSASGDGMYGTYVGPDRAAALHGAIDMILGTHINVSPGRSSWTPPAEPNLMDRPVPVANRALVRLQAWAARNTFSGVR